MRFRRLIHSRLLAFACILFLLLVLAGCGEGASGPAQSAPPPDQCGPAAVADHEGCRTFATRRDAFIPTPFLEGGEPLALEAILFTPLRDGPFPVLVFHHGSTGNGTDPSLFGLTYVQKMLAAWFVDRGWMVVFPQRRGRGKSGGLYDEGFVPDRSAYSCRADLALAGAERALADLDAASDWLLQRPEADTTRMLVGGQSRGGILALVHLARRPGVYRGAINFVGGWLGEGCGDHLIVNQALVAEAAHSPQRSLWLYADNDSFYSLKYSRGIFAAFIAAGGSGEFRELTRAAGVEGHYLVNDPPLWGPVMVGYLDQ